MNSLGTNIYKVVIFIKRMKKVGLISVVLVLSLCLLLSFSFVSASWFSDFWGKITGKAINPVDVQAYYTSTCFAQSQNYMYCDANQAYKVNYQAESSGCDNPKPVISCSGNTVVIGGIGTHTCSPGYSCATIGISTGGCRIAVSPFQSGVPGSCASGQACYNGACCTPVNGFLTWGAWSNVGSCGQYQACKQQQSRSQTCTPPSCGGVGCGISVGQVQYTTCGVGSNYGCSSGQVCSSAGSCVAAPCTVSSYNPAPNTFCGSKSVTTNCGTTVSMTGTLSCPYGCTNNACAGCTVSSYTPALNTFCGTKSVTTNCGTTETKTGTLSCPYGCTNNVCAGCTVSSYTPALNTFCGTKSVTTNCGGTETKTGTLTCSSTQTCTNNVCVNNPIVTCTDTDGGKDYYVKGTTSQPGSSGNGGPDRCILWKGGTNDAQYMTDQCAAGYDCLLLEGFCSSPTGNSPSGEYYNCPNGCKDGVCLIPPVQTCTWGAEIIENHCSDSLNYILVTKKALWSGTTATKPAECKDIVRQDSCPTTQTCVDSDGGKDYYVKGSVYNEKGTKIGVDFCRYGNYNPSISDGAFEVPSCSNGNCQLVEAFCLNNGIGNWEGYTCPNGCKAGACIGGNTIEPNASCSKNYKFAIMGIDDNVDYDTLTLKELNSGTYLVFKVGQTRYSGNLKITADGISYEDRTAIISVKSPGTIDYKAKTDHTYEKVNSDVIILNEVSDDYFVASYCGGVDQTCTDTDGGLDYYVKGTASGTTSEGDSGTSSDECITQLVDGTITSTNTLMELYCENNVLNELKYGCPNGCKDGACISSTGEACLVDATKCNLEWTSPTCGLKEISSTQQLCRIQSPLGGSAAFDMVDQGCSIVSSCPLGCVDGKCVSAPSQACSSLIDKKGIMDFSNYGLKLRKNATQTYYDRDLNSNITSYYAEYENEKNGEQYGVVIWVADEGKDVGNSRIIDEIKSELWTGDKIYIDNVENQFYILGADSDYSRERFNLWYNSNVLVYVYVSTKPARTSPLSDSTKVLSFVESLKNNNQWDMMDNNIGRFQSEIISQYLENCNSKVQESCLPAWQTKTEPVICPEHGFQTIVSRDINYCGSEVINRQVSCSPGMCSGCMVPRWLDSQGDNKCVPYGFRFAHQSSNSAKFTEKLIIEQIIEGEDLNMKFSILPDNSIDVYASGDVIFNKNSDRAYTFKFNIDGSEYNGLAGEHLVIYSGYHTITVEVFENGVSIQKDTQNFNLDIHYDSNGNSYFTIKLLDNYNAYCEIDGYVHEQKTMDSNGGWANCQNNYECESNICSSGECIELVDTITKFKGTGIRIFCKLANLFSIESYGSCVSSYLGEDLPTDTTDSSSGGGSGGGSKKAYCGNGICEEDCNSCPKDCGSCSGSGSSSGGSSTTA